MATRVGIWSIAHLHAHSYADVLSRLPEAEFVGFCDDDDARATAFAVRWNARRVGSEDALLADADAVIITSENNRHRAMVERALASGKHVLCEKPVAANHDDLQAIADAAARSQALFMTAFPCRYSPSYERAKARVAAGEIGEVLSICATNHGVCPFGWFVDEKLSGGGAMMDHVVHVADLLRDLLGTGPAEVYSQTSNRIYGEAWEDTAYLHLKFPNGVFATLDSSWSRPTSYKTWGDVKMNIVGTKGVIELDMFSQGFDVFANDGKSHVLGGYGSNIDELMMRHFLKCIERGEQPKTDVEAGVQAAKVALAGYESARIDLPVALTA